ncbi:hypothetical protein [Rhodohalobacter sulfatireducens]|uniref:Uncharacterized protein n=1 Tax=Rhodohalobacter sulfatireducens TaxID=2911366 RepID=A0ABS9KJQ6_9BACT|nr:hypothetical protein [Rhodohalobacter sulfatireducens]MCG2591087.1 hypothetical protein [Rhodohalobacter sulfatireducens]
MGIFLFLGTSCENAIGPDGEAEILQSDIAISDIGDGGDVTLYAGQHTEAGKVVVNKVDGKLEVTFSTNGWCLQETQLQLWQDDLLDQDFVKGRGNLVPGQFKYSAQHDCATSYTYAVDESPSEPWNIAAHAVVQKYSNTNTIVLTENSGIVYGIKRSSGEIYAVDVVNGTANLEFQSSSPPFSGVSPNGLAYDGFNNRMYYTNYRTGVEQRALYYYDYGDNTEYIAGEIGMEVAAADFYNGKYYAMDSYPATDNLHEISFNADGTIASNNSYDISGDTHKWEFSGDIAIKEGVLFGWGLCRIHNKYEYFTYNLSTEDFEVHNVSYTKSLQLAFGSNGVLYGHRSGTDEINSSISGNFYEVNTGDGSVSAPSISAQQSQLTYTDTASGFQYEKKTEGGTETAWGSAVPSLENGGGNWSAYFEYTP